MIDDEEDDAGSETAIDETNALQPDFNPSRRVTQHQRLSKLHELHKRRLQIKSKFEKKFKDGTSKYRGRHPKDKKDSALENDDTSLCHLKSNNEDTQDKAERHHSPKKRQKLHWGLDTKKRWERKANM